MDNAVRDDAGSDAPAPDEPALVAVPTAGVAEPSGPDQEGPEPESAGQEGPVHEDADQEGPDQQGPVQEGAGPAEAVVAPPTEPALDSVLDHDGPWSEEDYRALTAKSIAQGDGRAELIDGALVVGPGPTVASDTAIAHVRTTVEATLPDGLVVLDAVPVRMGIDCLLVPDMVVTRAELDAVSDPQAVAPVEVDDVLMVVEIIGPEHGALDRSFKPQVYARSRVPYLLLVDHQTPCATASMLISGRYHEFARAVGTDELELEEPFPLRLPLRPA